MSYDAVMLVGFGGPDKPEDIEPFLDRIAAGRGIPVSRLAEVAERYRQVGGKSPINEQNRALLAALQTRLGGVECALGNRNSAPFIVDTLRSFRDAEKTRILAVATTPWVSYSSCRQYRENLADALAQLDEPGMVVDMIAPYRDAPGIIDANVSVLMCMLNRHPDSHLVFTTHSIPLAMDSVSGVIGLYAREQREVAAQIVHRLRQDLGAVSWTFAYQSRSGDPSTPWLAPDINKHLEFLKGQGITRVLVVPMGFLTDHMEVIWDLDREAAQTAAGLGMEFFRAPTIGDRPEFLDSLAERVRQALHDPDSRGIQSLCSSLCCPNPRAEKPVVEGVCHGVAH